MYRILIILAVILLIISIVIFNSKTQNTTKNLDLNNIENIQDNLKFIIKSDLTNDEISTVIKSLPNVNWERLAKKNGRNIKKDLALWISKAEIEEIDEITSIIKVTNKFTKQDNILIVKTLADIFSKDKEKFIKALGKTKGSLKQIGHGFYFNGFYDREGENLVDDFQLIFASKELTNEEKSVGYELIDIIATCET